MNLDEMKLAVCEKLPELIEITDTESPYPRFYWCIKGRDEVYWPIEGLHVCHEAEKLIDQMPTDSKSLWLDYLGVIVGFDEAKNHHEAKFACEYNTARATYEQRLEALCRVWFPERWT